MTNYFLKQRRGISKGKSFASKISISNNAKLYFMGSIKNLQGHDAIEKIQDLGEDLKICMFCTNENEKLIFRPMSVNKIDEIGDLWFLSDKSSNKNKQIEKDQVVELVFGHGTDRFMSLHGNAYIETTKEKIKELWTPIAKIWFTEGEDDPNISCIRFSFDDGYYWDTKHGKIVETIKMATALVTGKTMDDGIEGRLER